MSLAEELLADLEFGDEGDDSLEAAIAAATPGGNDSMDVDEDYKDVKGELFRLKCNLFRILDDETCLLIKNDYIFLHRASIKVIIR